MYNLILSKSSEKFIEKQDRQTKTRIEEALNNICQDPKKHPNIKALKGKWAGYYRYRVGEIRIIYRIEDDRLVVIVIAMGYRGDIY